MKEGRVRNICNCRGGRQRLHGAVQYYRVIYGIMALPYRRTVDKYLCITGGNLGAAHTQIVLIVCNTG